MVFKLNLLFSCLFYIYTRESGYVRKTVKCTALTGVCHSHENIYTSTILFVLCELFFYYALILRFPRFLSSFVSLDVCCICFSVVFFSVSFLLLLFINKTVLRLSSIWICVCKIFEFMLI